MLAVVGVFIACSAVLLDVSTPVSVVIALVMVGAVAWVGLRFLTPWGHFKRQLAAAQKQVRVRGEVSDLLRLRLDRAQYGEVRQTIETLLLEDTMARKSLVHLVDQLKDTRRSINLVGDKAGVDLGLKQLLDSANDFIIAKVGQTYDIHRHRHAGTVTETALNRISRQAEGLTKQLLSCQTELVAASGRDSWDDQRLSQSQKEIRKVSTVARNLNRDPFADLDGTEGSVA
jgi:hypothetical protein